MTIDDAQEILGSHHESLFSIVQDSWEVGKEKLSECVVSTQKRALRSLVFNLMAEKASSYFHTVKGVQVDDAHESVLVSFDGRLAIRFKKLSQSFRPSNLQTQRQLELFQPTLPGMSECPVLTVGYVPDRFEQSITIHVVCHLQGALVWDYQLMKPVVEAPNVFELAPSTEEEIARKWDFASKLPKRDLEATSG